MAYFHCRCDHPRPGGRPRTIGATGRRWFQRKRYFILCHLWWRFFLPEKNVVVVAEFSAWKAVSLTKYATKSLWFISSTISRPMNCNWRSPQQSKGYNSFLNSTSLPFMVMKVITSVDIKNLKSGLINEFKTDGAFVFIGYLPNTEFL